MARCNALRIKKPFLTAALLFGATITTAVSAQTTLVQTLDLAIVTPLTPLLAPITHQGLHGVNDMALAPLAGVVSTLLAESVGPNATLKPLSEPLLSGAEIGYKAAVAPLLTELLSQTATLPGLSD